jgi:poly(3-hydroxybutyrate) depolymerase
VVSIWHGTADATVDESNADGIARQWRELHGLPAEPSESGLVEGYPHRAWRDQAGKLLIEEYRVTGMGHGTPLATKGECGCGEAGAFMLEVGISSTVHSARTWGLLGKHKSRPATAKAATPNRATSAAQPHQVGKVIEDALRAAGLMK